MDGNLRTSAPYNNNGTLRSAPIASVAGTGAPLYRCTAGGRGCRSLNPEPYSVSATQSASVMGKRGVVVRELVDPEIVPTELCEVVVVVFEVLVRKGAGRLESEVFIPQTKRRC